VRRDGCQELLPALHDDVAVERVEFHQERAAAELLGGDEREAGADEGIEDDVAGLR
jgi:hypothetical protein